MVGMLTSDIAFHEFLARVPRTRALSERFLYSPTYQIDEYDRESHDLLALIRVEQNTERKAA